MELISRRELNSRGVTDGEIRAAAKAGSIEPIRRGFYVDGSGDDMDRYLCTVRATSLASTSGLVISHRSAAAIHGFAVWPDLDRRVHLTANRTTGGRTKKHRVVHASALDPDDVVEVDGLLVTSPARTAVDLACAWSFESAVCTGDSALRAMPHLDLGNALERGYGRRGIAKARRAVAFMDGRSETVGESRSRVRLQRWGFSAPRLQSALFDDDGHFVARVDFEVDGVIGEFDGLMKYRGPDGSHVLISEKLREDRLRSLGWQVVRWTWNELTTGAPAERLRQAIEVARTLPPPRTIRRV
ncbi:hypothetical protein GCM10007304_36740 [Rhodococcoides trifolii]|uniref:Transcriptional regulator, AbiEi antitoxin, Type IV TA system n=1 Tax=Rhodococcoides trifolii TaxID=908250 RepID=A0A917G2I6_9NOCA|nr:type IV toxin-antitoxin system AbiEi family antitoxin domain-containing protein [Rhodococcus trifolii]GGG19468.1 hypothetical protein GCM10007304_36740 [Rhodococcus trifolii]